MNNVPCELLPELWLVEIIGKHLWRSRIYTRIALRRTCKWFYQNVPAPRNHEKHRLLDLELKCLIRWEATALLRWRLTLTKRKSIKVYFLTMSTCLQQAKFAVFETMWGAFADKMKLLAMGRRSMRLGIWMNSAVRSNSVAIVEAYLSLMHANGYLEVSVVTANRIMVGMRRGCYETVTWLFQHYTRARLDSQWRRILEYARKDTTWLKILYFHLLPNLQPESIMHRDVSELASSTAFERPDSQSL